MGQTPEQYVVAALYKFVELSDYKDLQGILYSVCRRNNIIGTLLLAQEGINGTVAGSRCGIDGLLEYFNSDPRFADLEYKESFCQSPPFSRLKIKLKKEIVTLGLAVNPSRNAGTRLDPNDWNALIQDPETIVIDTRNDYEVAVGNFKNARNPQTGSFREFPKYVQAQLEQHKDKKIAMYCTGGIRCEKSTAYLKEQGFKEVYHLKGGILGYLEKIPKEQSLWQGECFVFDGRVTVDSNMQKGHFEQCHACRRPISKEDQEHPYYMLGISCPHCYEEKTPEQRKRYQERQKQREVALKHGKTPFKQTAFK